MNGWKVFGLLYLTLILGLATFVGNEVNSFLGIGFYPKELPEVPQLQATLHERPLPIVDNISVIVVPKNSTINDLYNRSITTLLKALESRTGSKPKILEPDSPIPSGRIIAIGSHQRNPFVSNNIDLPSDFDNDSFALRTYTNGNQTILAVIGGSKLGDAYGIYWLADEILTGVSLSGKDIFSQNVTSIPRIKLRLVGLGGVGIVLNPEEWGDDYSLNDRRFEGIILKNKPYINETAFEIVKEEFKEYIHRMIAYGYNGIVIGGFVMGGFLEYVNFDLVGNGYEIYGIDSIYRERHIVFREKFGELFKYAHDMGLKVILGTDMVALTGPLEQYFIEKFGKVDVSKEELWEVYRKGIEELFTVLPYIDGLMIRIGEAGAAYNIPGWDYRSELYVKTVESTEKMLRSFLPVFEKFNKILIFRTWTVGVGEIGDLHTNPETYEEVLGDINSPNLIVSTKYCMGDFYSYHPFNPTFKAGNHLRMVEFQARREFEGFCAFPNYLGPLHQQALKYAIENSNLTAMWIWTQGGGPLRASPMTLYPFYGFWLYIDANVYVTAKLAWNPDLNLTALTEGWISKVFGNDPMVVYNITRMLLMSREAILKGLYISEFAEKYVKAFGLEPPPMMWIFEWDRVCGSTTTLSGIYKTCKNNIEKAIEEGFSALETVKTMKTLISGLEDKMERGKEWYKYMVNSLNYEESLLETLAWYRKFFLKYYQWLENGNSNTYKEWVDALKNFKAKEQEHLENYGDNLDFPAYNFKEADAFIIRVEKTASTIWTARILLAILICSYTLGISFIQRKTPQHFGKKCTRAIWLGTSTPWNLQQVEKLTSKDMGTLIFLIYISIVGGFIAFSLFSAFYLTLGITLLLTLYLIALTLIYTSKQRYSYSPYLIATLSPLVALMTVIIGICSIRGPFFFWYQFWAQPTFRLILIELIAIFLAWSVLGIIATAKNILKMGLISIFGRLFLLFGVNLSLIGALTGFVTLEKTLTIANEELVILPFALSDILGITTHLNIDSNIPWYLLQIGIITTVIGITILIFNILKHSKK